MSPFRRRLLVMLSLALLGAAAFAIYSVKSRRGGTAEARPAGRDVPYLDGKWIRYSADYSKRSGLEFALAAESSLSSVVHVTGTVTFDPEKVAAIGARIAGRVRSVAKLEGDEVKTGDVLAEIESAELGQAQASLISARAHAEAAIANEKREAELADERISARREAELAAASAASARAELLAAERRVHALGGKAGGEVGVLSLASPIAGKVIERNVSRGQSVEPSYTAFRVADLSRVWIELAVFERGLASIRRGDAVDLSPQTDLAAVVAGTVSYVGDVIDLETRTAPVRVVVEQHAIPLRPGQSVVARIHTATAPNAALVVARSAITSVDGRPTVFVAHDALSVEPRAVQLGSQDGSRVEILSGLERGESVAVAGVFALKSEIFR
jgi:cobalt-zinc-cadmium efflux system membrane fusion protein